MTAQAAISTYGWDTAFGVRIEYINVAIKARKASPTSFRYVDSEDSKIACEGSFCDWSLVRGGSGDGVNVMLPMTNVKGTTKGEQGYQPYTWSGGSMTFTIRLELGDAGDGRKELKVKPTSDSSAVPVVEYYAGDYSSPPDPAWTMYALQAAVTGWCEQNLEEFAYIFAIAHMSEAATGWKFLQPTTISYAYEDGKTGQGGFLGVVAMSEGGDGSGLQQVVDKRIVQGGDQAGFCVSPGVLVEKLAAPNLMQMWKSLERGQLDFGGQSLQLKPNENVDLPSIEHLGKQYTPQLTSLSFVLSGSQIKFEAYAETVWKHDPLGDVSVWCQAEYRYTIAKETNPAGEPTLAVQGLGPPDHSHGHHVPKGTVLTGKQLAEFEAIASKVLSIFNGAAPVPVVGTIGGLLTGTVPLSPAVAGTIQSNSPPSTGALEEAIQRLTAWTDSEGFKIDTVDLDGALRLGGSLGLQ